MVDSTLYIGNVSLGDFLLFIFLFVITVIIANFLAEIIRRFLRPKMKGSTYKIPARVIQYLLVFFVTYYGLYDILGFDFTAFFAAFGIIGIAVAFSAQQTIQNLIAGIFILGGGIIRLDDWVEVSGLPITGLSQVKDIGLTRTTLREYNGRVIILPNSVFVTNKLVKYPDGDFFRVSFDLKISSKTNLDKGKKTIIDICNKNEKTLPNIPKKEKTGLRIILKNLPEGHQGLLGFLQRKVDIKRFEPKVMIKEISGDTITLEVWIWIWEIKNKEKIISNLMNEFLLAFPRKGVRLV
ncbi:MAG: mechanosensitive ion channel family protein [Candidatus Aenigmarchaeota archaeon]|nr:mechanosensitive ion channel family protein [Candidatus Aenigmarchaeota archaeon]